MSDETPASWRDALEYLGRNLYPKDWLCSEYDKFLLAELAPPQAELKHEPSSILPAQITYTSTEGGKNGFWPLDPEIKSALHRKEFRKHLRKEAAKRLKDAGFHPNKAFDKDEFCRIFCATLPKAIGVDGFQTLGAMLPRPDDTGSTAPAIAEPAADTHAERGPQSENRTGPKPGIPSPKGEVWSIAEGLLNRGEVKNARGATAEIARRIADMPAYRSYAVKTIEEMVRHDVNKWCAKHSAA